MRYCIEASNSDPCARHGHERDNLADYLVLDGAANASKAARAFLKRGCWVEIYHDETKELMAGPFDPDQPEPSFIL